jgi:hypothetical protein
MVNKRGTTTAKAHSSRLDLIIIIINPGPTAMSTRCVLGTMEKTRASEMFDDLAK